MATRSKRPAKAVYSQVTSVNSRSKSHKTPRTARLNKAPKAQPNIVAAKVQAGLIQGCRAAGTPSGCQSVASTQVKKPRAAGQAIRGKGWRALPSCPFSSSAVRAGLRVSELKAESSVLTAMVSANCLKKAPVIPLINRHGTKTAVSTSPTAMTGPLTNSIAARVASRGANPLASSCSTDSTTTIASSTTIPMASTRPKSVRLLME
jgi:hypothetical protein